MGRAPASDYTHIQDKVVLNQLPFKKIIMGSIKQMRICFHVETGQMFCCDLEVGSLLFLSPSECDFVITTERPQALYQPNNAGLGSGLA